MTRISNPWKTTLALTLALSLTASLSIYGLMKNRFEERLRNRFHSEALEATSVVEQNLSVYTAMLYSARGLFAASREVDRGEWRAFVESQRLEERYRGITALRYIEIVKEEDKQKFVEGVREDKSVSPQGYPDFKIHSDCGPSAPSGYCVVKYVEPYQGNEAMLGTDISCDPGRRQALDYARDTGREEFAIKEKAFTDARGISWPALRMMVAVFRSGQPNTTQEDRQKSIQGYVDITIHIEDLFSGFHEVGRAHPGTGVEVYDRAESRPGDHTLLLRSFDANAAYRLKDTTTIRVGSHVWTVIYYELAAYGLGRAEARLPLVILLAGICLSFALTGILFLLIRSISIARGIARGMTRDLEASRNKLQAVVSTALDGILTADHQGTIVAWNSSAQKIFGYSPEEIIGKSFLTIVPVRSHGSYLNYLKEYLETGKTDLVGRVSELDALRKGGEEFPIEISVAGWNSGKNVFFTAIMRDISERRRHEEEMKKMTIVVRQSPASIMMTDAAGVIEYVNFKFCELTGYSAEEVIGKNPRILKSGMTAPEEYTRLWNTITSGKMWRGEFHNKKKNGELCWVAASISPVKNAEGVITHFVGVQEDITERKKAQQLLMESEEKYRAIFQNSGDAMATFSHPSGKFLSANPAAQKMFGVKDERELMALEPWALSPAIQPDGKTSIDKAMEIHKKVVEGGTFFFDWTHKRINGEEFPATVLLTSTNLAGKITVQATIRDVSDQKSLEKQFLQAQKMEAVGVLAGGIAHDFNNLLTVINGYSQMQIGGLPPGDAVRADLEEILKAGKRAETLVKQLLAFSRKQVFQLKVIDVSSLIQDMEKMLKRLIPENIEFDTSISEDIWTIKIDPDSLHQVLTNLVINASHAMPNGGKITIGAKNVVLGSAATQERSELTAGDYLLLTVSDTGAGMSDEVKAHLFEPFFTTKEKGKGTGLGLSTVYGIVKQSGGQVQVYSELGRGTTFSIYLPRVAGEASLWYDAAIEASLPRGTETILVVEDDATVRGFGARILRQQGYTVLEASGGEQALSVARGNQGKPIQALFTDMVMPGMGGKELADQFESAYPGIKVLFTSGYTENAAIHAGSFKEQEAFLKKPYSPKALSFKIREILDRKRGSTP